MPTNPPGVPGSRPQKPPSNHHDSPWQALRCWQSSQPRNACQQVFRATATAIFRDSNMNAPARQTILSCRNIWKVYAEDATPYFSREVENSEAAGLSARMREDGAIPAAVDVSFDVQAGEIFVIMGLSGSG